MFYAIVQNTPHWVWGLLVALLAFGLSQTRDRDVSILRVTLLPLAMVALSVSGVLSAFGHLHLPVAIGGWLAGAGAALTFARQAIAVRGATWSEASGVLRVPGSWVPLALIVGLFSIKYFAGVSLALNPPLAGDSGFAGSISLAYGVFAGLFLARAMSLRGVAAKSTRSNALRSA